MSVKTYYALRLNSKFYDKKRVGSLVTVEKTSNHNQDFCGEYTYKLSSSEYDEVFKVGNLGDAIRAKHTNIEWYNSTADLPTRDESQFKPEAMDVVKVKEVIEMEVVKPTDYPLKLQRLVGRTENTRINREMLEFTLVEIQHERLEDALKESIGTTQEIGWTKGEIIDYEMVDLSNSDQRWFYFVQAPDDKISAHYHKNEENWNKIKKHPERYAIVYYRKI